MNGHLLDTHTLLWSLFDPDKLSPRCQELLTDAETLIYVSSVSFWEIALKSALGKLTLTGCQPDELPAACQQLGFFLLPLLPEQAASFHRLPRAVHKDPFDRMLIWQAIHENLILVSKDSQFQHYQALGLKTWW